MAKKIDTLQTEHLPLRKIGRPLKFTPDQLWARFISFVEWCDKHPLYIVQRTSGHTGDNDFANEVVQTKPRLVSVGGFLIYIGSDWSWYDRLDTREDGEDFIKVKTRIGAFCEQVQKELASSGIYKENIIARLLGLADKQQFSGDKAAPIYVKSAEEKEALESIGDIEG